MQNSFGFSRAVRGHLTSQKLGGQHLLYQVGGAGGSVQIVHSHVILASNELFLDGRTSATTVLRLHGSVQLYLCTPSTVFIIQYYIIVQYLCTVGTVRYRTHPLQFRVQRSLLSSFHIVQLNTKTTQPRLYINTISHGIIAIQATGTARRAFGGRDH